MTARLTALADSLMVDHWPALLFWPVATAAILAVIWASTR